MIALSTLADYLQTKLNASQLAGLSFVITADTAEFNKSIRQGNNEIEHINGLLKEQSSEVSTLTSGEMVASLSCRLQLIFRLDGDENDIDVVNPDDEQVIEIIKGNQSKIKSIRQALTNVFQTNEQKPFTSDGKTYNVSIIYGLVETGERTQGYGLGDSFSFSANIYYFFVENGLNTNDVKYYLDGIQIPFQANTVYRTPTTDGNVYADTVNGEVRNIQTQSIFSVSFELPALKNNITKLVWNWIFGGGLNTAHILTVETPSFSVEDGKDYQYYLVMYGENKAIGETVKNIGQSISLVEAINDYDLLNFPSTYKIYKSSDDNDLTVSSNSIIYFYNFSTKTFGRADKDTLFVLSKNTGDYIISTGAFSDISGLTVVQ